MHDLPAVGTRSSPDLDKIRAARPRSDPGFRRPHSRRVPGAFRHRPDGLHGRTRRRLGGQPADRGRGDGRADAANGLIDDFTAAADRTGTENDAAHFQASVVQFTDTSLRVFGPDSFPGSVLADVGVERPAAQRFTDKPYVEVGTTEEDLDNSPDFSLADGDITYVSFASPAAKDRAGEVMNSDAWKALSATRDNRVFVVNNEVWQTGEGIVAARGMLTDLRWINTPIN